jgi:Dynamin family
VTARLSMSGSPLAVLRPLAVQSGAPEIVVAIDALSERIREGLFYVAVLGQFKRGKSTLVNTLLDDAVLPVGVAPVTSVVTVVRHGTRGARTRLGDRDWESISIERARDLVSEAANPQNKLGVRAIEISLPAPLLASGMCLVDTPGVGSVFGGNTAETRAFVPHVDAAVVVLGTDPPISGEELALVTDVGEHVRDVLFVLAKADRFSMAELAEARAFTATVLADRVTREPELFEVSALEVGERRAATRDWSALVDRLESLARENGAVLVERAAQRGAADVARRLLADVDEQRGALVRPLEQTRARLAEVRKCVVEAEQALRDLGFLLQAEQRSVWQRLYVEQKQFIQQALPRCQRQLDKALVELEVRRGPKLRTRALAMAQDVARAEVEAWMDELRPKVEQMYRDLGHRFIAHANEFLARLRESGRMPEGALDDLPEEGGLRFRSSYYFNWYMRLTTASFLTWLAYVVRTQAAAQRAARRDGHAFMRRLVETNSSRVVNDLNDRVLESRRQLEADVRARLGAVVTTADRALARAEAVEREGQTGVERALARLDETRAAVAAVFESTQK